MPLNVLITAKIVNDQPFPIWPINVGATSGVQPAETHLIKLAAPMTEAECFWYESTMYVFAGVCTTPTPRPTMR